MSESENDRKDLAVGDPDGEWDAVVRRLSERIRRRSKGAPTTQTSLDLAGELVRLERRARDAEDVLEREREAFALRVGEMEEKLRKLDPWVRQLKSEFQKAAAERDRLRDELDAAKKDAPPPPSAADVSKTAVIEAERLAALRDAEAAHAARQAAVAEAESLRKRIENEKANVDSSAAERIAEAERARDQAIEDAKQLRKSLGESRKAEDEVRRLGKQIEVLETTTSAHKAVARAAQEALESALTRLGAAEAAERERSQSAAESARRVTELTAEIADAQQRLAALQKAADESRGGEEQLRRELREQSDALDAARAELDDTARNLAKHRADADDATSQAERTRGDTARARDELTQARRDAAAAAAECTRANAALEVSVAACEIERAAAGAAQRDAADSKEIAEEAIRSEADARRRAEDLAAKFASAAEEIAAASARARAAEAASQEASAQLTAQTCAREDAEKRAAGLAARAAEAETRAADLASEAELAKGRVRVVENDAANLNRTLDDERRGAVTRFETAEASWRSQMRAAESRFEADIHHERERAREVEEVLHVFEARHGRAVAEHEEELTRIRTAAMQFVAARTQDLVAGIHRIVGDEPIVVPPLTMSMDADANERTPTRTVVVAPMATVAVPPQAAGEWDRLMSGVEQLQTEVEGIGREHAADERQETKSISIGDAAEIVASVQAAAAARASAAPPPSTVAVAPPAVEADDPRNGSPAEPANGRRKKKRR